MSVKALIRGCFILGVGSVVLLAAEPWNKKPYTEWTEREVWAILERSPWDRSVFFVKPQKSESEVRFLYGPSFSVRWNSALTVRQARVRRRQLAGELTPEVEQEFLGDQPPYYVLGLYGPLERAFAGLKDEEILASAYLELARTKRKLSPVKLRRGGRGEDGSYGSIEFFFLRDLNGDAAIPVNERKVTFRCAVGEDLRSEYKMDIKAEFDLRKMMRDGKPDL